MSREFGEAVRARYPDTPVARQGISTVLDAWSDRVWEMAATVPARGG